MGTLRLRYDWDYSDYARLPDDGNRYEVIDGELLVTPAASPGHQHVSFRLAMELHAYVSRHSLGLMLQDVDLLFQTGQFLRPDILVVPESSRPGITRRGIEMAPSLVVEILSPSTASRDRGVKAKLYARFGVEEYWIVDPDARTLEVFERDGSLYRRAALFRDAESMTSRLFPGLTIHLVSVWA